MARSTTLLMLALALGSIIPVARIATAQPAGSPATACGAGKQVCPSGCCEGQMAACSTFPDDTPPAGTWCYTATGSVSDGNGTCQRLSFPVPTTDSCCPISAPFYGVSGCWGPIPAGSAAAACGSGKQVCPSGCCDGNMKPCANFTAGVPPAGVFCYDAGGAVASSYSNTSACSSASSPVPVSSTFCCPTNAPVYAGGTACKSGAGLAQATAWLVAAAAALAVLVVQMSA